MRRIAVPLAMTALLALGGLVALDALRLTAPLSAAEQALRIAAELRCPDCQSLSVAESQTAAAIAIRQQIGELLASGETPDQVRRHFVERYGDWILLSPPTPLVWMLPVAALLAGLGLLAWWLRRGEAAAPPSAPADPDDPLRRRIRDEEEQVDA